MGGACVCRLIFIVLEFVPNNWNPCHKNRYSMIDESFIHYQIMLKWITMYVALMQVPTHS